MIKMKKLVVTIGIVGMLGTSVGMAQAVLLLDEGFGTVVPAGWTAINVGKVDQTRRTGGIVH